MRRIVVALSIGLAGGIAVGVHLGRSNTGVDYSAAPPITRDIVAVPAMSVEVAESQRQSGFDAVWSVEDTLRFPTEFLRTESLYVLAGRSDSAALQELIFEADRIADFGDRSRSVTILFHRLTELDPQSGVVIARTASFAASPDIERTVWTTWARMDLDAALAAAANETGWQRREFVAQTLYSAFGFVEGEDTARVERELGIPPNRIARGRYIRSLAERSPDEAIALVNAMDEDGIDRTMISSMARAVGYRFGHRAAAYGEKLASAEHRELFHEHSARALAELDPEQTIGQLLGYARSREDHYKLRGALSALAARDLDLVIGYFQNATREQDRREIGSAIVRELGRTDHQRAVDWALANDRGEHRQLVSQALRSAAADDPQMALDAVGRIDHQNRRRNILGNVLGTIAEKDRAFALSYLESIEDRQEQSWAAMSITWQWAREDPEAALAWALDNENIDADSILHRIGDVIVRSDVDAAIRLLPRIEGQAAKRWRYGITEALLSQRSIADAQQFVAQFEGQSDYNDLQARIIGEAGANDADAAMRMIEQMVPGPARDKAYTQLVHRRMQEDPQVAAEWLDRIENDEIRRNATTQVVQQWNRDDPVAAQQWIERMPDSDTRNVAIIAAARSWTEPSPSRNLLIESITDLTKRAEARRNQIQAIARNDWRQAEVALAASSLSSAEKDALRQVIDQYKSGVP